ncbi:MAG: Gfo/Idh/MocA family oxidoreductase [Erysipelotrichaceae bacterium]|nr:Gfo/Idh/MocA family oxidoreductase [Erysipelotrichaceae bacterium]
MKTVAVCGAGLRGQFAYPPYSIGRNDVKFVAVADLNPKRVETFKKTYGISDEMCFKSADELLKQGKIADAIIIATMDKDHYLQTIKAINLGYDILLEKPISPNLDECLEIERLALEKGVKIIVCHVLRYTPFYKKIKQILDNKVLGQIINVEAMENVGHWHQAHSFVRGNWCNSDTSSPMILQKCCHDLDIYSWLLNSKVEKIQSFGDLTYFKKENAPIGAPERCLQNCEHRDSCPYDVYKVYLSENVGWPTNAISADTSYEARYKALENGPYGKCVFYSDNNVVDHQTINMKYENGVCMVFTMTAFSEECNRTLRIMGSKGELKANMNDNIIEITNFSTKEKEIIKLKREDKGHGGGDFGIMDEFLRVINNDIENSNPISASVHSHVLAFAAEYSRINNVLVDVKEFCNKTY